MQNAILCFCNGGAAPCGFYMKLSALRDAILFYIGVPRCVGCGEFLAREDRVFCPACRMVYDNAKMRNCSRCAKVLSQCTCPNDFLDSHYIHTLVKVTRYIHNPDLPQNRIIYSLKQQNRRDVADFMAEEVASAIRACIPAPQEYLVTFIPRRRASVIKYGFDHAKKLARKVAVLLGAQFATTLRSTAKRAQKSVSGRQERVANAAMERTDSAHLGEKPILLIDDIVTTGASMANAATLLRADGAKKIVGAVFAIAYLDPYVPFERSAF